MTGKTLHPGDDTELAGLVAWAAADGVPLEIIGNGSKRGLGHAIAADHVVDMSERAGIVDYEPAELVLTVEAGTTLATIEKHLEAANQQMAFEPPDYGPLLGGSAATATIGGTMAGNLSGPRRVSAGAARDHALGLEAVTGRGEVIRAGGRVMKNVTGYDLTRLLCGSWGTLAVITRLSLKVLPAPEKTRTLLVTGLTPSAGCRLMGEVLASPHDVSAAAWLPADMASKSAVGYVSSPGVSVAAVRIEGPPASVLARHDSLLSMLAAHGPVEELHGHNSEVFWKEVRDVAAFVEPEVAVMRLSVPPASGAVACDGVTASGGQAFLDWGGGLVWCAFTPSMVTATAIRDVATGLDGHATLIRAGEELKAAVPVFHPQPVGRRDLARRIREGFDPCGILNPGRMGLVD